MTSNDPGVQSRFVTTEDGVRLHYLEAGSGPNMIFLPGWTLTAELWRFQIKEFSRTHHVIALDHRGQGRSEKPVHGYRISRLAADVHSIIETLEMSDVIVVAHSMGCAVTWAYWELFGGSRLSGMVLIDQPPVLVAHPHWPAGLAKEMGVIFEVGGMGVLTSSLRGTDAENALKNTLALMWTPGFADADRRWVIEQSMLMSPEASGAILFDNAMQDWRTVLPNITVPALVVGGEASLFPAAAAMSTAESIQSSTIRILSVAEKGSHLSFLENPQAVNEAIHSFLGRLPARRN